MNVETEKKKESEGDCLHFWRNGHPRKTWAKLFQGRPPAHAIVTQLILPMIPGEQALRRVDIYNIMYTSIHCQYSITLGAHS